jgi:Fic-DOC domain mobile mystery protein B
MKFSGIRTNACGATRVNDATQPKDATPGEDTSGLILTHLTSRGARNAAELDSISRAYDKHIHRARKKRRDAEWLTDEFLCDVHKDMFGSIWTWAGKHRTDSVNIGVEPHLVPEQIRILCGNFRSWDSGTMQVTEIAARLQNGLTKIHPFINGNGRHARLITDIFFHSRGHRLPAWPQTHLEAEGDAIRDRYITAMKAADQGEFTELIRFIEGCLTEPRA